MSLGAKDVLPLIEVEEVHGLLVAQVRSWRILSGYHVLPAMLLNELQRRQRGIAELRAKVQEIDELRAHVRALVDGLAGTSAR